MADPLNLIKVPDTGALRALSQHLKVSVDGYDEHLHGLSANQAPLQKNWEGDGMSAYAQSNAQLMTGGAFWGAIATTYSVGNFAHAIGLDYDRCTMW